MSSSKKTRARANRPMGDLTVDKPGETSVSSPIPSEERKKVLYEFNDTAVALDERLLHELFEEQVRRTPTALALVYEGRSLTYVGLNRQANQVAAFLRRKGVGPDHLVGLYFERNPQMIAALLGILKAGGAYVPLDPAYPKQRLAYLLNDSMPRLVVTEERLRATLPGFRGEVIALDTAWKAIARGEDTNLDPHSVGLTNRHLAYLIYTSGSTGEPKGVAAEHRSMVNRIAAQVRIAPFSPDDVCCHKTSIGFVDAIFEVLGPLCYGRPLVLAPTSTATDPLELARLIQKERVTRLISVPSLARTFLDSDEAIGCLQGLRGWTLSGEALQEDLLLKLHDRLPKCSFINLYGSSEVAGDVTWYATDGFDGGRVPIGRPIENTQVYVLDDHLQPVSIAETGQIYVAGAGLARGYFKRPEMTAERFLADPFRTDSEARMYQTGDLGRWRPDGTIEYLGRSDDQVKIRGFRIEPGEIEAQLVRHPGVKEAVVVVAREEVAGEKRLVGYVVPKDLSNAPSAENLRQHLKEVLPEYMVPSAFVVLEAFPLTPNGKLDRQALPAPDISSYARREYESPQGEMEEILAGIWQKLLHVEWVGRGDNFFEIGGDSLLIVQMLERLRRVGISAEARCVFENPGLADLAATLNRGVAATAVPPNCIPPDCEHITPEMLSLIDLESEHLDLIVQSVPGGAANVQDIYPLAPLQQGLLFHHLLDQRRDTYVISTLLSVASRERLEELIAALQWVVDRHDILRTAVLREGVPQPVQVVYRQATLPVEQIALDRTRDPVQQLKERMNPDHQRLDLRQAPLMRLEIAPDPHGAQWYALLQTHHLVCDEQSMDVLLTEVTAYLVGRAQELPEPVPYRDHVAQALMFARTHDAQAFFRGKLGIIDEPTAPFGLLDVHGDGSDMEEAHEEVDAALARRVRIQARRLSVSAATLFHAAWALVVSCTCAREDVVYGTVLLGRMQGSAGAERILGVFINTLPLRLDLRGLTAEDLVQRTQRELVELLGHEQASLAEAQRCSGIGGSAPLFTALLNYRHSAASTEADWASAGGIEVLATVERTNYPITLAVDDLGEGFTLTAQTDRRIEPRRVLAYLQTAMASLSEALEQNPKTTAVGLEVLPEQERRQIIDAFNATEAPYPQDKLIHELFEEQVVRTPEAVAVVYEGQTLTYADLNARANQLAWYLRARGVGPDQPVGICLERSLEMVVGLLGILKAGGAYLPLDPGYPAERLAFMLEDAAPGIVLIQERLREQLPPTTAQAIALDGQWHEIARQEAGNLRAEAVDVRPDHLAYVIYTSGSTGWPKGVMIEHRNVVLLWQGLERVYAQVGNCNRIALNAPINFDASVQQLVQLLSGRTVSVVPDGARRDPPLLMSFIEGQRIEAIDCTPSQLKSWVQAGLLDRPDSKLRMVLVGGEAIEADLWRELSRSAETEFYNVYGPTECTVDATAARLVGDTSEPHIGRPMDNRHVYILNREGQRAPIGVAGEIYVGGAGVARGYLNRPELTAERFLADPFSAHPKARMYKTGDLGRWRPDGTIEYLGRNDQQVKIRGFRIELGEIEARLVHHAEVKEAVVVAREEIAGEKRLVAYLVPKDLASAPSAESLRRHLKEMLPEYMVPNAFVTLEALPLTPNGKLDRRALPAPNLVAFASRQYEPPQGEVEEILAGIWQELLQVQRVGRNDNFFELGGHSLLIVQMMERLRRVGLSSEIRRVFESPTLTDLAGTLSRGRLGQIEVPPNRIPAGCEHITPEMLPLVELAPEHVERIVQRVPAGAANIQDIYPLTPLQEGMLFHHLLDREGADIYAVATLLSVSSRDRLEELISALQSVIDRHDALRTAVLWEQLPQPVQVVYRQATLPVDEIALDRQRDAEEQLREWMRPERQRLDLRQAPLMRLQIAADARTGRWFALLRSHHIVADYTSQDIVTSEVVAHLERSAQRLPDPVPYRNHVAQALMFARTHDAQAFFRGKLGIIDEPTAPFGLLDVHGDGSEIEEAHEEVDAALARRVRIQARRLGVSAATLFHAAWALVVSRTCAREDVVYGTVLLGRMQGGAGAERILGVFINTLPLRLDLQGLTAEELVQRTQRELVELLGHEQASLAEAQRCSGIGGSTPLFTTLLNYRHSAASTKADWASAGGIEGLATVERTNYPITLSVDDLGEDFTLTAQTHRKIDPDRILGYLDTAIRSLVLALEHSSQTPVVSLEVLPEAERRHVIETFNPVQPYPQEKLIQELFEGQVRLHPDAMAVICEGESLTYRQLNARANQLAWYLRAKGIGPDQPVGICLERSLEMVVGLLGILKAGGAYLPLDPGYPAERLAFMLEDAAPRIVLTQERLRRCLPAAATVVALDTDWPTIGKQLTRNPSLRSQGCTSSQLAYVIYTSGSTGRPKGVMVEHRNVVRLFAATEPWFGFNEQDVWTLFHSFAFDFSVWELWGALLYGGRVVIVPYLTTRSPKEFYRLLCQEGVTVLNQTPSAFAQLIEAQGESPELNHALRVVIFGGEALEFRTLRPWVERNGAERPQLVNMYGITETTVHVTYRKLSEEEILSERGSLIGKPIPDLQTYLLDPQGQPVPIGMAGEIYVGGAGIARGYLNRPELTAERFVADLFSADPKARMYKTGDLGRWRSDGTIEYLGRNDDQVKIRGFRIELGEIEAQLVRHSHVREVVVVAREDREGEKRLVAYLVPKNLASAPSAERLREHLKEALPEFMVPSAFVALEKLPLTPNGKLDRRALPAPDLTAYASREYEPPQGEVEEILAGIWQALLHVERVGRNDNFFELGGHSLLIVQMMERLRRVGLSAEVRRVFESPTLADLASTLIRGVTGEIEVPPNLIPPGCEHITPEMLPFVELAPEHIERIVRTVPGGAANVQDIYPLAPLQEGILFHHLLDQQGGDTYVLSTLLSVTSRERLEELISALQSVVDRHDILRTAVLWERLPRPVQVVYQQAILPVAEVALDLGRSSQEQVREWLRPERQRMDLRQASLMRLQIAADTQSGKWYALLQLHHITCDHVTAEIITSEVVAHLEGRAQRLAEPVPYRNHVARTITHPRMHDSRTFFRQKLYGVDESTAPFGLLNVHGDGGYLIEEAREEIEDTLAQRLRAQARRLGVSSATLFHAAWALVVARTSAREDVVYGTVLLGRMQGSTGTERTLGVFINTLPLTFDLKGMTAKGLVEYTQRELVDLLGHEQASLAEAQRCSGITGPAPLFTTLLNYRHSVPNPEAEWSEASGIEVVGDCERTNYPITVSLDDLRAGFTLTAQTDRRVDPHRVIGYLKTAMQSLVEALERSPETPALTLRVLPECERHQVLEAFNATQAEYPKDKLIHEFIEERVERGAEATAVVFEGQSLTYAELNARANQLAWFLREKGVGPDRLVGICVERSLAMVVGLLGILKAGGAYMPLNPGYPSELLAYMLEDAAPKVVLTQERLKERLPRSHAEVIALDGEWAEISDYASSNLPAERLGLRSDHLAYVIYTSGSTGRPKGAMNEHRAVVNRLLWMQEQYRLDERDRVLQKTPFSFDVSVWEIFSTLMSGARLLMARPGGHQDPSYLRGFIEEMGITTLHFVPSMLQAFLEQHESGRCPSVRHIVCSGEELSLALQNKCLQRLPQACLSNLYGPTECAVDVTAWECAPDDSGRRVPIGRPIANTRIHILDRRHELVPIGVAGEIYIAGAQVGRGYLNRPDLTAERFLPDPFSAGRQARMYKTGDLGRWRADGTIEYLGRNDQQVKIRGFRIELGEIEAQLVRHPEVREAVVLAREDEPGEKRLVGYVIPQDGSRAPSAEVLREHLKGVLPEYMVPSAYVTLECFPLTPNGKLNRRALPVPEFSSYVSREYVPPQGEVEEMLAGIWQELLHIERVGRNDNFFELGGHSLLGIKLIGTVKETLGTSFSVAAIFQYPTVQQMAKAVALLRKPNRHATGEQEVEFEEGIIDLSSGRPELITEASPAGLESAEQ